jgi:adhesin/invasin
LSVLLAVIAFATLASCDQLPLSAPTDSIITLNVNTTVVPINGSAEIIASVTESAGTPVHNGTVVTFTSSFGTVEPRDALTQGGRATAKFIGSSQSGVARIGAFSGASRAEEIEIRVGGAAAERVAVRTDPATVPQAGGTVQVIAIVTDASGNPLPGAPVVFSVDNGILANTSGVTDQTGQVQTSVTTNRQTTVRANVAGKEGTSVISVVSAPTITITPPTGALGVGVPLSFTVTAASPSGGSPIQLLAIEFGDGTGVQNLGTPTGPTTVAHTFSAAGTFVVTATVIDITGQKATATVTVAVQRILPTITLTPTPPTVAAGGTVTFAVVAAPATNGPPITEVLVTQNGAVVFRGTGSGSFSRQFNSAGTFTFEASATDTAGSTATTTSTVVVTGSTMTLDAFSSTSNVIACVPLTSYPKTCQGVDLKAGTDVILTAGFTGTAPGGITQFSWSFGNGAGTTTSGASVTFRYSGAGTFVVSVTALSGSGVVGSQTITLIVR